MSVFYSEFDPGAVEWLRELIRAGEISPGDVDERDIREVPADDLRGRERVHLFAGIGGWDLALRLAGWPADRPVWTGSCPCQPYSAAGKGKGDTDPRNLWPEMFRLVRECRPDVVFGEQVEGAVRHGWLDRVCADLEREGYAVGAAVLGAHSVGAPHIRQRLYWVADADGGGRRAVRQLGNVGGVHGSAAVERMQTEERGSHGGLADADGRLTRNRGLQPGREHGQQPEDGRAVRVADPEEPRGRADVGAVRSGPTAGLRSPAREDERRSGVGSGRVGDSGSTGFWSAYDLIPCRDGKSRRVEPGTFPLADGIPGRVGLLRGYGNAINPYTAAAFVRAYRDVSTGRPLT